MSVGGLIASAVLGVAADRLYQEITSRVWGIKVGQEIPVGRLFNRIQQYCEDYLYIFAGSTHWISVYDVLIQELKHKKVDVRVLCYRDDICSDSADLLRQWDVPVKPYPYRDLDVKGLVVDGTIYSLYKGHPAKTFCTRRLMPGRRKKVTEPPMVVFRDRDIVDSFKVLFLNVFEESQ